MRSSQLTQWLVDQQTGEVAKENLDSLPAKLYKELLDEALSNWEISRAYNEAAVVNTLSKGMRERIALRMWLEKLECWGEVKVDMPGWYNDKNVPTSKYLEKSALFGVYRNKPRVMFRKLVIASSSNTIVRYTGEQLFQTDLDVFLALISIAEGVFNSPCVVPGSEILAKLGIGDDGRAYKRLKDTLDRLYNTGIEVELVTPGKGLNPSKYCRLLYNLSWRKGEEVLFSLDPQLAELFMMNQYTLLDWNKRKALGENEIAKKLQGLIMVQQANQTYHKVSWIQEMCQMPGDIAAFTRNMKKALSDLQRVGIIDSYWIEKPKQGMAAEKKICVWKKKPQKGETINPNKRGTYYPKEEK